MPSHPKSAMKKLVRKATKKVLNKALPARRKKRGGNIRGHGGYFTDLVQKVAAPFMDNTPSQGAINSGARMLGEGIGNKFIPIPGVGKLLGNAASWFSRILGHGSYRMPSFSVNQNSLMKQNQAPSFSGNPSHIRLQHREFLFDLQSSTAFSSTNVLLNPGNPLIPWLSVIASNYEEFRWEGLVVEFKTTSAVAVGTTSSALGTVVMATDYDVLDANYPNKRAMEITDFATSVAPCYSAIHPIECDPRENVMRKMFVQSGLTAISQYPDDPRFSLPGNFQIATVGMQTAGQTIGEVWLSYDVVLSKPQLVTSLSQGASQKTAISGYSAGTTGPLVGATSATPAPIFTVVGSGNTTGQILTLTQNSGYAGTWMVTLVIASVLNGGGAWTVPLAPSGTLIGGATRPNLVFPLNANGARNLGVAATNTAASSPYPAEEAIFSTIISTSNPGDGISIPYVSQATTANVASLFITPFSPTILSGRRRAQVSDELAKLKERIASLEDSKHSKNEVVEDDDDDDDLADDKYQESSAAAINHEEFQAIMLKTQGSRDRSLQEARKLGARSQQKSDQQIRKELRRHDEEDEHSDSGGGETSTPVGKVKDTLLSQQKEILRLQQALKDNVSQEYIEVPPSACALVRTKSALS
jgi:hypothetical protein